jgi:hypothetical protein
MKDSFITPGHVRAFQAVTSRLYDSITLWSCRINGEAGVAIVMVDQAGDGSVAVMPLFVAITSKMDIQFAGEGGSEGGEGGPNSARAVRREPGVRHDPGPPLKAVRHRGQSLLDGKLRSSPKLS